MLDSPKKACLERSASEQAAFEAEVKSVGCRIQFDGLVLLSAFFLNIEDLIALPFFSERNGEIDKSDSGAESNHTVYLEDLEKDTPLWVCDHLFDLLVLTHPKYECVDRCGWCLQEVPCRSTPSRYVSRFTQAPRVSLMSSYRDALRWLESFSGKLNVSWKESFDTTEEDVASGMMKLSMVVNVIPGLDIE